MYCSKNPARRSLSFLLTYNVVLSSYVVNVTSLTITNSSVGRQRSFERLIHSVFCTSKSGVKLVCPWYCVFWLASVYNHFQVVTKFQTICWLHETTLCTTKNYSQCTYGLSFGGWHLECVARRWGLVRIDSSSQSKLRILACLGAMIDL